MRTSVSAVSKPTFGRSIWDLLNRADIRRADDGDAREPIFRLRYRAYFEENAILPNPDRRFTDPYDETDNAWIFGVYIGGELVSSIRLHVATDKRSDMPSLGVFEDQLRPLLAAGAIIIDPTRHVVNRDAQQQYPQLVYLTMRVGWMAGDYFGSDYILAAVRTEHQAFYQRVFGHRLVAPARKYPLLEKPISLMILDFQTAHETVYHRYPFFRSTQVERRALFERLTAKSPNSQSKTPVMVATA